MGLSHDLRRAIAENRRIMARRNREQAEEAAAIAAEAGVDVGPFAHFGKVLRVGSPENKMLQVPENKAPEPVEVLETLSLEDVPFASDAAAALAKGAGLTPADFAGRPYSGKTGFTSADVRAIIEES